MSEKNMVRKMNLIVTNMSLMVPFFSLLIDFPYKIYVRTHEYVTKMCDTHSQKEVNVKKEDKGSVDYMIHCSYLCCTIINKR